MNRLLALLLACLCPLSAHARNLPEGDFVVTGALRAILDNGIIVPTYLLVSTSKARLDWTFVTLFEPGAYDCEQFDKCHRAVQTLSHVVEWREDGTLRLLDEVRKSGDGLAIGQQDVDAKFIYPAINRLVRYGTFDFEASGGHIHLDVPLRDVERLGIHPGGIDLLDRALSIGYSLDLSLSRLNECDLRQIIEISAAANRTEDEDRVWQATAFLRHMLALHNQYRALGRAAGEDFDAPGQDEVSAREDLFYRAFQAANDILQQNGEAEDTVLRDAAKSALDVSGAWIDQAVVDEIAALILGAESNGFLAAARYTARYSERLAQGEDPYAMICSDITLSD